MRPLILSIFALFLAGCTHSQQSMVDTFRASLFDNQDITVADQQIQAFLTGIVNAVQVLHELAG